jgi:branched-chain amino acid aminotransferase
MKSRSAGQRRPVSNVPRPAITAHAIAPQKIPQRDGSLTWFEGRWHRGDIPLITVNSPGAWLGQSVFDGARAFGGVAPDLDKHCARVIASARAFGLEPPLSAPEIERLAWEGIAQFPAETALYIRPLIWAGSGFITPDSGSARFALTLEALPLPEFTGFTACLSSFRRPAAETAPTEAKAGCLYPNVARAQREAEERGFDTSVVRDLDDAVAEFATANLFIVSGGVVLTPVANGTFLNGITRQRIIHLLARAGIRISERRIAIEDVLAADEVFATGNYAKIKPCVQVERRSYPVGPITARARELYFEWARGQRPRQH